MMSIRTTIMTFTIPAVAYTIVLLLPLSIFDVLEKAEVPLGTHLTPAAAALPVNAAPSLGDNNLLLH